MSVDCSRWLPYKLVNEEQDSCTSAGVEALEHVGVAVLKEVPVLS